MAESTLMDLLQNSHLGHKTERCDHYNPNCLFSIQRTFGRADLHLGDNLPFFGVDIWTSYEFSWLNPNGLPCIAMLELYVPCTSPSIIESKALKLYLNSFSQTTYPNSEAVKALLIQDLSASAGSEIGLQLYSPAQFAECVKRQQFNGICIDEQEVIITDYHINESYLLQASKEIVSEKLFSLLFRSNCPVTNQPDWASISIAYSGPKIDRAGLLRYLVSFRNHTGFHEQCVEKIFCDISKYCQPKQLSVYGRFTRRGGIDTNPFRTSEAAAIAPLIRDFRQ